MKKIIAVVWLAGLVLMAGCNEDASFSRYPSISIPECGADDYVAGLSSENAEMVYNAVCNLGNKAAGFGRTLSSGDADPSSDGYKTAQAAYRSVSDLLQSHDPQVVAASLRFLQLFAVNYKAKTEIIDPVCGIKSSHPLVQFEQVELLKALVDDSTRLPAPLLKRLLESKSWIVSRSTYNLVGMLPDEPLRKDLIRRYRATTDEAERMLLLAAIGQKPTPEELVFFENEMLAAELPGIRSAACDVLLRNMGSPEVEGWVVDHYEQLSPKERDRMFEASCCEDEPNFGLYRQFLAQGYEPKDDFLKIFVETMLDLREGTADEEMEALRHQLEEFETFMLSIPELAARIEPMREAELQKRNRHAALQAEYEPLSLEFYHRTQALLMKHGIPEPQQQKFLKAIPGLDKLESR